MAIFYVLERTTTNVGFFFRTSNGAATFVIPVNYQKIDFIISAFCNIILLLQPIIRK
jgi:hypothetical protein